MGLACERAFPMPDPCPVTTELERLIGGRLPEPRAAALTDHVGHCPACQERIEALAAGGDKVLTTTVRQCRVHRPPTDSAMWPALSAVEAEVAATAVFGGSGDTDPHSADELDLKFLQP